MKNRISNLGVVHADTKRFLPYPLDVLPLDIHSGYDEVIGVHDDDKTAWSGGGKTPLVIEFRLELYVPDSEHYFSQLLLQRARELGVDVSELPARATLPITRAEEDAFERARYAVRTALWYPILRWAHLEEKKVRVG
jgi:hypothetical protein